MILRMWHVDLVQLVQHVFGAVFLGVLLVGPCPAVGDPVNVCPHGEDHVGARAPGAQQRVHHVAPDLVEEGHGILLFQRTLGWHRHGSLSARGVHT